MDFEWDEAKRQKVIEARGVDIFFAARIFRGYVLTHSDDRQAYGEERFISLGMVGEECFVVVHTQRGNKTRLITAWKGGQDERDRYQNSFPG